MADLIELQKQLNNIEELLALLVQVSEEKVPQLKNDINAVVRNIKGGFDKEELARQIRDVLNQVINQSSYAKLKESIDITTKKMTDAIETSSNKVSQWQDSYQTKSRWHFALVAGVISFVLGAVIIFGWENSRIDKYQHAISQTDAMAGYINSECKLKSGYGRFVGQPIDCKQSWSTPTEILENRK